MPGEIPPNDDLPLDRDERRREPRRNSAEARVLASPHRSAVQLPGRLAWRWRAPLPRGRISWRPVKIPDTKFPDLSSKAGERLTGIVLARGIVGKLTSADTKQLGMLRVFARVVDGVFLDYQLMRDSYYRFWEDTGLGGTTPISAALVPYLSHAENCICNVPRAIKFCDAVRRHGTRGGGSILVEQTEWRLVEANRQKLTDLRNAVQHLDEEFMNGVATAGQLEFHVTGEVRASGERVPLTAVAATLTELHDVGRSAIARL